MGKITLLTLQGREEIEGEVSVADTTGLTKLLGYRPYFCTKLDKNSLAQTWFNIWSSSPKSVDILYVFDIDEEDCIPMNVLDWTNKCLCREPDEETLKGVLNKDLAIGTDYLVRAIPEDAWKIELGDLFVPKFFEFYLEKTFGASGTALKQSVGQATTMLERTINAATDSKGYSLTTGERITGPQVFYAMLRCSGFVPFFWSLHTGMPFFHGIFAWAMPDFVKSLSFQRAQDLLGMWDRSINNGEFTKEQFTEMHDEFIRTLNTLAVQMNRKIASIYDIGRNDACFCGSGKKFKKCCEIASLDKAIEHIKEMF